MPDVPQLLAALAEPTRLRAMQIVWRGGEHCVCDLMSALDATQSRMSRHMAVLKAAGLVVDRRDAQWVRYRRNPDIPAAVIRIVDAALAALEKPRRRAA
ncbi:metalloregulator ArsR/SmtB family transcription factor [Parvibaculum sp.]|uniref:ArsR/SmtB family transcription factor n=1 Tax=Parvibaculum sp. TaxID=2024848 RepID=UPI0027315751|nr:metalloregulator ArsR/SmtB family transcription factor [Parvibaculum sp.]MDP1628293.1 metalloregulator ArsR/SmtB family transcription factor [Parvibaculum sp.]MDP2149988.1 metalloregulator ArsR/SmtB family transcription factor [Parvibaculum sp.]MDP3330279.1 metalloregulator ArsR/SmtB family transcription factor [Parvibaculum sp.]